jgi:hypothetical protein
MCLLQLHQHFRVLRCSPGVRRGERYTHAVPSARRREAAAAFHWQPIELPSSSRFNGTAVLNANWQSAARGARICSWRQHVSLHMTRCVQP